MPLNVPGLWVPFQLLWNPRLALPHVVVQDIRQLDFWALRRAGYRGVVFDKDNCLTLPNRDSLVPELQVHTDAWNECKEAFGEGNVLIVSNSAGTPHDPGGIQAESVAHRLSAPVLHHRTPKPGYACIAAVRAYFAGLRSSPPPPPPLGDADAAALIVVGDRICTDVVMANRMRALAVWTRGVWEEREGALLRGAERALLVAVRRATGAGVPEGGPFVKPLPAERAGSK